MRPEPKPAEASLFIKLEKYQSVVENLNKLRSYAQEMQTRLDSIDELRKQLQSAMENAEKVLNNFNSILAGLDSLLFRTGVERTEMPRSELEEYIKDLHSEVEKIRSDLKTI